MPHGHLSLSLSSLCTASCSFSSHPLTSALLLPSRSTPVISLEAQQDGTTASLPLPLLSAPLRTNPRSLPRRLHPPPPSPRQPRRPRVVRRPHSASPDSHPLPHSPMFSATDHRPNMRRIFITLQLRTRLQLRDLSVPTPSPPTSPCSPQSPSISVNPTVIRGGAVTVKSGNLTGHIIALRSTDVFGGWIIFVPGLAV